MSTTTSFGMRVDMVVTRFPPPDVVPSEDNDVQDRHHKETGLPRCERVSNPQDLYTGVPHPTPSLPIANDPMPTDIPEGESD